MKVLEIPKYSLLGWSDGGSSSFIHAAKYPDSMIKLVCFGTKSYILPSEIEIYKSLSDLTNWSDSMKAPMFAAYGDFFPEYLETCIARMKAVYDDNDGNICVHIMLKDIKCPTFILYGQKDSMVDNVHAPHLVKNIPNSRLCLYPDGKHNIHMRYAKDFNRRVQEFLLSRCN